MKARGITTGVAVARGVGGRRGREHNRARIRRKRDIGGWPREMPSLSKIEALVITTGIMQASRVSLGRPPEPPGYRERGRRAKLRRRARDRAIAVARGMLRHLVEPWRRACELDRVRAGRVAVPWWSTPEGRRRWTEDDRARKRDLRAMARAMGGARIVHGDFVIKMPGPDPLAALFAASLAEAEEEIHRTLRGAAPFRLPPSDQ